MSTSAAANEPAATRADRACDRIVIAEFAWPAAQLSARLLQRLLRDAADCAATIEPARPEPAAAALADGASWLVAPTSRPLEPTAKARTGAPAYGEGEREGFFAPRSVLEAAPGAPPTTLSDALRTPEIFAPRPGETPRLHLCPADWRCHEDSVAVVQALDLAGAFDVVTPKSGEALVESLMRAAREREPWIGYFWTPSEQAAEFSLRRLPADDVRICGDDGACRSAFQRTASVVAYSKNIETDAPEAAVIIERFTTPAEAVLDALAWRRRNNATWDDTADYVFSAYPALWAQLLTGAERERFAQALQTRLAPR